MPQTRAGKMTSSSSSPSSKSPVPEASSVTPTSSGTPPPHSISSSSSTTAAATGNSSISVSVSATTATTQGQGPGEPRRRLPRQHTQKKNNNNEDSEKRENPFSASLDGAATSSSTTTTGLEEDDVAALGVGQVGDMSWARRNQWIVLAVASGACAAFNGVFAKLTTNDLTSNISKALSNFFGLTNFEGVLEVVVRGLFFGLNLVFNGIMWTLFTQALAKGQSTTQVSIMNTSTNFMITALLGLAIFAESLPPLWWVGAAMLVAGNVIIGRRKEGDDDGDNDEQSGDRDEVVSLEAGRGTGSMDSTRYGAVEEQEEGVMRVPGVEKEDGEETEDEDVALLGDLGR
ncbi:hypothetical protein F4778DRAFT_717997 [Xylariomycetidae sp. FL2044]|nr:hypothetical protein F4778DRAFT_717997 [Xylariomycetidae sp. FL2044]